MSVTVKCHLDTIHRTCIDISRAAVIAHSWESAAFKYLFVPGCLGRPNLCMQDTFARARTRPCARATIGYLVYNPHLRIFSALMQWCAFLCLQLTMCYFLKYNVCKRWIKISLNARCDAINFIFWTSVCTFRASADTRTPSPAASAWLSPKGGLRYYGEMQGHKAIGY